MSAGGSERGNGLLWYQQKPMLSIPAYTQLKPMERLAIRELRDLAAQLSPDGLPDSPVMLAKHLRIPKAAIEAVLDDWFKLDAYTGKRFDQTLAEDLKRVAGLKEQKAAAGRASAIARGFTPKNIGKIRKPTGTGVEQPFKSDSSMTSTYAYDVSGSGGRVLNRTDGRTDGRTTEEAAPVSGGSLESSPPTGGPTPEWMERKAQLRAGGRSNGFTRGLSGGDQ
jgi:hypothetical protein